MALHNSCKLPAALFLIVPCLWAQNSGGGHLAAGQPQKVTGKRSEAVQAKIPISVEAGYHVNSNKPAEEYLIPLRLTWTSTAALEGGEVVFPKPSMEKYEFSEKPLSVFTGNFNLVVNFKIAAGAPAGPGAAIGKLRYQACNDKACFPPKTIEISIPYQVQ